MTDQQTEEIGRSLVNATTGMLAIMEDLVDASLTRDPAGTRFRSSVLLCFASFFFAFRHAFAVTYGPEEWEKVRERLLAACLKGMDQLYYGNADEEAYGLMVQEVGEAIDSCARIYGECDSLWPAAGSERGKSLFPNLAAHLAATLAPEDQEPSVERVQDLLDFFHRHWLHNIQGHLREAGEPAA